MMNQLTAFWPPAFLGLLLLLPAGARSETITYQQGLATPFVGGAYAGTEDTFVRGNNPDLNFGGRTTIVVGDNGDPGGREYDQRRGLMRFDVTSSDGQFASISSVTLRLRYYAVAATSPLVLQAYEIDAANTGWVQGTGEGDVIPGTSSWSQRLQDDEDWDGGQGLGDPGDGFSLNPFAEVTYDPTLPTIGSTVDLNVPIALFESWVTGANSGILLRVAQGGAVFPAAQNVAFDSSNAATQGVRPSLIIEGTVVVPEPTTGLLAVMGLAVSCGACAARRRGRPNTGSM